MDITINPDLSSRTISTDGLTELIFNTINPLTAKPFVNTDEVLAAIDEYENFPRAWHAIMTPEEEALAAALITAEEYKAKTQERLDAFAKTRDYESMERAITYVGDPFPRFDSDGCYCKQARSDTWSYLFTELGKVKAGLRTLPDTWEELEAELPNLEWPEDE